MLRIKYLLIDVSRKILQFFKIDPVKLAYRQVGISRHENLKYSGEEYFINSMLSTFISPNSIIFDVGAHSGSYSEFLCKKFPNGQIYSFEPNPNGFQELEENSKKNGFSCFNTGLSSEERSAEMFTHASRLVSDHASIYKNVFIDLHKDNNVKAFEIKLTKLDVFCEQNGIESIDFLKIDTEGHELDVLKGASRFLLEHKIKIIQFEFNEMNIISRVFLKDFYDLLGSYNLYRLNYKKLIPMPTYDPINEIFRFQNIIAILKSIDK